MSTQDAAVIRDLLSQIRSMQNLQNEKAKMYADATDLKLGKLEERVEHLDECFDRTREEVRASTARIEALVSQVADSIPNRDFNRHLNAHTRDEKIASDWDILKLEAKKALVRWAVPLLVAGFGSFALYTLAKLLKDVAL